jgi:hexosaminidase
MSWRGEEGGIAAAKQKHDVIMTPGNWCYFDHYQDTSKTEPMAIGGLTPVREVYTYEPLPAQLSADETQYVLGAQANLWTEYILSSRNKQNTWFIRARVHWPRWCGVQKKTATTLISCSAWKRI